MRRAFCASPRPVASGPPGLHVGRAGAAAPPLTCCGEGAGRRRRRRGRWREEGRAAMFKKLKQKISEEQAPPRRAAPLQPQGAAEGVRWALFPLWGAGGGCPAARHRGSPCATLPRPLRWGGARKREQVFAFWVKCGGFLSLGVAWCRLGWSPVLLGGKWCWIWGYKRNRARCSLPVSRFQMACVNEEGGRGF